MEEAVAVYHKSKRAIICEHIYTQQLQCITIALASATSAEETALARGDGL